MREDVRPYIRRNTKTPPKLPSELFLSLYVIVSPTKYEDTAETPLRVLVFMLSCHCVIDEIRKHRRNSPPSSCLYVVMSLCHRQNTKTPPKLPSEFLSLCCHVIVSWKTHERTDRRFSRPTFSFCRLMSSTTKGPTADFPDRPFTFAVLRYSRKISDGKFGEDRSHLIKQDTSR